VNRAGFTLVELLIAAVIVVILALQGVRRISLAEEDARADRACATLRNIWVAQRLYHMEHPAFDANLADLSSIGLVEPHLADQMDPYGYTIDSADAAGFVARATRHGLGSWIGSFTIDQTGAFHGSVDGSGGEHVAPPVQ
jgi:prepilin-type N-terminal cleavage/methylation domain-containing protein